MAAEVSPRLGSEGRDSDAGRRWEAGSKGEGLPSPVHLRISVHLLDLLNILYIYIYIYYFSVSHFGFVSAHPPKKTWVS